MATRQPHRGTCPDATGSSPIQNQRCNELGNTVVTREGVVAVEQAIGRAAN